MNYKTLSPAIFQNDLIAVCIRTILLVFLFFLLTSLDSFSQGKEITVDGRKAIIKPSGKWEYVRKERRILSEPASFLEITSAQTDHKAGSFSTQVPARHKREETPQPR